MSESPGHRTSMPGVSLLVGAVGTLIPLTVLCFPTYFGDVAKSNAGLGSLIFIPIALASFICCVTGILLGVIALRRIGRGMNGSRKAAWAGIVLGAIPFVGLVIYLMPIVWMELIEVRLMGPVSKE